MNEENILVITDREELYDKCENMEQLFDKYYLPLLDKHYSKTYELQQENETNKTIIKKQVKRIYELEQEKKQLKEENKRLKEELRIIKEHPFISTFYKQKLNKIKELEEGVK